MTPKQIGDGNVIEIGVEVDPRDQELERLRQDARRLQRDLSDARLQAERAREDADRALSNLRRQLGPLYRALQMVFGELDAAGVTESQPAPNDAPPGAGVVGPDARTQAVWNAWKQKLNAPCGRIIDALLIHGEMNTTQLAVAAQMHKSNVSKAIQKLNDVSVINKNGGRFSLKQL